jgi:hypothetical protein
MARRISAPKQSPWESKRDDKGTQKPLSMRVPRGMAFCQEVCEKKFLSFLK